MTRDTIAIASDHAGVELKETIKNQLSAEGYDVLDLGTNSSDSVDYPDYAAKVAHAIDDGKAAKGVLICGTGIGISIAANRFPYIRAALCCNAEVAKLTRQHNDANVVVLGARVTSEEDAKDIVKTFFATEFEGGRHQARVAKLSATNN